MPNQQNDLFYLIYTLKKLRQALDYNRVLFSDAESLENLSYLAPGIFALFQEALNTRVAILFANLLDKRRDVLSLQRYINLYSSNSERKPLLAELENLRATAEKVLVIRNEAVAHTNYEFAAGRKKLAPAESDMLSKACDDILDLLERLRIKSYPNISYSFDNDAIQDMEDLTTKIDRIRLLDTPNSDEA